MNVIEQANQILSQYFGVLWGMQGVGYVVYVVLRPAFFVAVGGNVSVEGLKQIETYMLAG